MRAYLRLTALILFLSLALAPGAGVSAWVQPGALSAEAVADEPEWVVTGEEQGGNYGYAVAAGDFDGDGDDDVLVGGPRLSGEVYREGVVYLYEGGAGGLDIWPSWSAGGGDQGGWYGAALASAGDVNGDEIEDALVGAYLYWDGYPETAAEEGLVELYYGAGYGLSAVAAWSYQGEQREAHMGYSVSSAGDIDGDGFDDVIVGSRYYSDTLRNEGAAFVFYGSDAGLASAPDWSAYGGQVSAAFGAAVASAGDLNDDGFDDVAVGAPFFNHSAGEDIYYDVGAVYIYYGSESGLSVNPGCVLVGALEDGALGAALAGAGDVNGDGYDDLLVGEPYASYNFDTEGAAHVYLGSPDGVNKSWSYTGGVNYARLGYDVGGLGDVDGDGYTDIVVGAYWYEADQPAEGRVFVFRGGAYGPQFLPSWWADGDKAEATFGWAVRAAGDVNRDNEVDLLVGAPEYRSSTDKVGRAFAYYGIELLELSIERVFLPLVANGAQ